MGVRRQAVDCDAVNRFSVARERWRIALIASPGSDSRSCRAWDAGPRPVRACKFQRITWTIGLYHIVLATRCCPEQLPGAKPFDASGVA